MAQSVGLLMVEEGLLSREALERAVSRKERDGGSLALNLVLEGAVDEGTLVHFYAERYSLPTADESQLQNIDDETFSLIPLEIAYDSGIIALYCQDETHLAVGLVDPSDRGLIAEATFFSGYTLVQHLITVSQMARHFARLTKQPWKIAAAEAEALARQSVPPQQAVHGLLEQTEAIDQHLEAALEADLDEVYYPNQPLDFGDGRQEDVSSTGQFLITDDAAEGVSRIHIQAPEEGEQGTSPVVVDMHEFQQEHGDTDEYLAVSETATASSPANPFRRADITKQVAVSMGLGEQDPAAEESPKVIEGHAETATGRVTVLGVNLDVNRTTGEHKAMVPVVSSRRSQFGERPKTSVPSVPVQGPLSSDVAKSCRLLTLLGTTLGADDPLVAGIVKGISVALNEVKERDQLGDAVVRGLGSVYQTAALMTLNGPRAVIWRAVDKGKPSEALAGTTITLRAGGVLHRIAQERQFFFGPLPAESNLREAVDNPHAHPVLVAPIELRGKTIILLYIDAGSSDFPSPGPAVEKLLVDISKGLERVILLRKRGRRK